MRPNCFLLLLLTILKSIEGGSASNPIFIRSIEHGGTISRHLKGHETVTNTAAETPEIEERMAPPIHLTSLTKEADAARLIETDAAKIAETNKPGAYKTLVGKLEAIEITGDKKGMVVVYSVLLVCLLAIVMMGYSIQKYNEETYVH